MSSLLYGLISSCCVLRLEGMYHVAIVYFFKKNKALDAFDANFLTNLWEAQFDLNL